MKRVLNRDFEIFSSQLDGFIRDFSNSGIQFGKANRNSIKLFQLNNQTINIKSFKIPNIFNQIAYRFLRKSKAQRSFEYANKLQNFGIGTPQPMAYYEFKSLFLFKKSYYISAHLDADLTFRELSRDFNYPNHNEILRAFTQFTFELHNKGVLFLDHSPGNTLIKKVDDVYNFFLVDLNRMQFKSLDFDERIKNFSRLTPHQYIVEIMSDEYAKCLNVDYDTVFNLMWTYTQDFQSKHLRKKRLKQKLKFWKQ
jgi:hypothetical protein